LLTDILSDPGDPASLGRFGNALRAAGDLSRARSVYQRGLLINPHLAPLLGALGNVLADSGDLVAGRRVMLQAIGIAPEMELAYGALAVMSRRAENSAGAANAFRLGLLHCPGSMPLAIHHGNAVSALEDHTTALKSFKRAWTLAPGAAAAANNIARASHELGDNRGSHAWFQRAALLAPDLDASLKSFGNGMKFLGEPRSAFNWLRRAVTLAPRDFETVSDLLFAASYVPGTDARDLRAIHDRYCAVMGPAAPMPVRAVGSRLRIGLASPDFSAHPVGHFIVGLLEHRDRSTLEIHCLSDTPRPDAMTDRLRACADTWEETRALGDGAWLDHARSKDFAILLDMAGHTLRNRLGAFAHRAAAVQGSWAGYVGTTGLSAMDFIIADRFHVPVGEDDAYREQVLRMPNGYISYTPPNIPPGRHTRDAAAPVTFASFNNPSKINQPLVELWGGILSQVPRSRLLLKYRGFDNPDLQQRLFAWLASFGVAPDRLVFEGASPQQAMLARYRDVDLVLDTAPYSGGATTCEALAMGVPVVTFPGATFASRHSTSHLLNAGLSELVASDATSYQRLAVDLARDQQKLRMLRSSLPGRMATSPHRDHARFARDFTEAMTAIVNARL
jgi:protein O-GlcNAc transferase